MLDINITTKYKRDLKRCKKRGYDLDLLAQAVNILMIPEPLPPEYHDHGLTGNYSGRRECHITPDWLLVYQINDDILTLDRTGSHSDLFDM